MSESGMFFVTPVNGRDAIVYQHPCSLEMDPDMLELEAWEAFKQEFPVPFEAMRQGRFSVTLKHEVVEGTPFIHHLGAVAQPEHTGRKLRI